MSNTSIPSGGLRTEQRLGRRSGQTAKQRQKDAARANRTEGEGRGLAADERRKGTPSRPPCGDTVTVLCGPACSAAPASSDQGFTVRCRRWSTLETAGASPKRPGAGGSLGGLQRAVACRVDWAGLARCAAGMYEYSRATGLYHWLVPGGTYR